MKKITLLLLLFISSVIYSQKNGITYQAIIFNPNGGKVPGVNNTNAPLANKNICLQFSIVDTASKTEYQETINTTTDEFGMVNTIIGSGNQSAAGYALSFSDVYWNSQKSLKVAIDINGQCSNFVEISNQLFTSVPSALSALSAENVTGVVSIESGGTNAITVVGAKTNLLLEKVDNTSDLDKPISLANQTALNLKEDATNKSIDVTIDGASDVKYPSVKSVKAYVDTNSALGSVVLNTEITRATTAEATLATNLNTETARATTAEGVLTTNLAAEVVRATTVETTKEVLVNKSTSVTVDATSDMKYPSVKAVKTYVDASVTSGSNALATETARATSAETTLTTNLTAEVNRATAAETANTNAILAEATTARAAELANSNAITAETSRATIAEATKENTANKSIDGTFITNSDVKFPTEKAVKTYVDASASTGSTALITEINRATAAEGVLTTSIANEASARGIADATLTTNLTSEVNRATTAETANTNAISAEAATARAAELANSNAIAAEISRATEAETANTNAISAEAATARAAELANANSISTEVATARAAELANSNAIMAETSRATTAEATKENVANKSIDGTFTSNSDVKFPTEKATKTYVDASSLTGSAALTTEINRATTAETANTNAISAEATIARAAELANANAIVSNTAAITTNANAISSEATTARAAELANANAIVSNTTAIATNANAISAEATTARAAELANANAIALNATAISTEAATARAAELANANAIVSNTASINTNATAISAEATTARAAELANTNAISTEATTARAAELANTNAIVSNTASINTNATAISGEATTARAAELANANAISTESTTARAAELANTNAIVSNTAAINTNTTAISGEATTARAAELANANAISTEATTARAAELANANAIVSNTASINTNATAISVEATTARAAELANANAIVSNTASINTNATAISEEATTARAAELANANAIVSNTASINTNATAISVEATTARAAELANANAIVSNTASINTNATAISVEATTARAAEGTLTTALVLKAPLASPTFTGTPLAPTAVAGTNTAQVATTAFVGTAITDKFVDLTTNQTVKGVKTFIDGIKTIKIASASLDQANTNSNAGAGGSFQWQSFTSNMTGILSAVEWQMSNPTFPYGNAANATVKIYQGEGVSGALLGTAVSLTPSDGTKSYVNFNLDSQNINTVSGSVYTILLTTPSVQIGWLNLSTSNPYSLGRADNDPNWDYIFKTYVKGISQDSYLTSGDSATALALKADLQSPTFTGTVSGIDQTMVGLGNVDNTSDVNKPISTETQTALDLKSNLESPTFTGTPTLPSGTIGTTQTAGDNTTSLATTAFVSDAITTAGSNFVDLSTAQIIAGAKTFTSDAIINTITVGLGAGSIGSNTAIGLNVLKANTTGSNNTANGSGALASNTEGSQNTANGLNALNANVNGGNNTATGFNAMTANTDGSENTANGANALRLNTDGVNNTAIGSGAMRDNTSGYDNSAIGNMSLLSNTVGGDNTANGSGALYYNTEGSDNTASGKFAMMLNTTGFKNTVFGSNAFYDNISGYRNTAIGFRTGLGITTGDENTILGANVNGLDADLTRNIIIANGSEDGSNIKARHDGTDWFLTGKVNATEFVGALTGNATSVTTNANLTGPITSSGNTTAVASQTGTGSKFVMDTAPTLVSPTFTGTVSGVTATMVGLGNVDNTSDANKPVSTATQTALNLKANLASPTFTGTVSGITKSMVSLGNVDNTTDLLKPVSTATQLSLDLKVDKVTGKGLSTEDYTSAEKTKLAAITGTNTGDQNISGIAANTSNIGDLTSLTTTAKLSLVAAVNETQSALESKVDKETGKMLSTNDYTDLEKTKLTAITGTNTGDQDISGIAANTSNIGDLTSLTTTAKLSLVAAVNETQSALESKVDKETGKMLSTNDYTDLEKTKLAAITGTNTGDQDISGIAANTSNIGDLTSLTTTAKSSLVAAVNEIEAGKANFVDLTTNQTIAGTKTFSADAIINTITVGRGTGTNASANTAVGFNALRANTTGFNNTASGSQTLVNNLNGSSNTANGSEALYSNVSGGSNTANGKGALFFNTIGSSNSANGYQSLYKNTEGGNNTASGNNSLNGNTTGNYNTGIGNKSLNANTTGNNNTAIGYQSLYQLNITDATAGNNTAIGYNTGKGLITGINNTILGANVGITVALSNTLSNNIIIANGTGAIKAQHDGTNWTMTGTVTAPTFIGELTGNAATVTTNANLTGPITSLGNTTSIADNAVTGSKIADGTITNTDISGTAAISYNKLNLEDSITSSDLTSVSVTTAKIADFAVGTNQLGAEAVATDKIADAAITTAKINSTGTVSGQVLTSMGDGSLPVWIAPTSVQIIEIADENTAAADQTDFFLTHVPSINSKVKMYINGIRISNSAYHLDVIILGKVIYDPTFNGDNVLTAIDRIQFDYYTEDSTPIFYPG